MHTDFRFALELYSSGGVSLGQAPLEIDFEPAEEWTRWRALRAGVGSPRCDGAAARAEPVWNATLGEPYTSGFRVVLDVDGRGPLTESFGPIYFKDQARRTSTRLVSEGKLTEGESFRYAVTAYPESPAATSRVRRAAFRVQRVTPALEIPEEQIDGLLGRATASGTPERDDHPVFVPRRVLEEIATASREARARETGGVLVGKLRRDPARGEIYTDLAAQLPAGHTRGDESSLTFTAETWADLQARLELRGRNEIFCGWWHSHPVYLWSCRDCPVERRRRCPLARDFLSTHDRTLHRTVFPRAFSVALVVNLVARDDEEETFSLFGWRRGMLQPRAFHVVEDDPGPRAA